MKNTSSPSITNFDLELSDNQLLPILFGRDDVYLKKIEHELCVSINARGNHISINGDKNKVHIAQLTLKRLYTLLEKNHTIDENDVDIAMRVSTNLFNSGIYNTSGDDVVPEVTITTQRKVVSARTPGQVDYLNLLKQHELVFGIGPAGTGKTYLAVANAVSMLLKGQVKRIILSRPAVEAGEKLGFLPGDIREKIDPYLRPLYDALHQMLPDDSLAKRFERGEIEVAPLAFMRGRTLTSAYIILDEAQNTTEAQMKMFLTRLGEGSRMVVTGDMTQIDLPNGVQSGLRQITTVLSNVKGIGFCYLQNTDVIRHPLVARIVGAYENYEQKQRPDSQVYSKHSDSILLK